MTDASAMPAMRFVLDRDELDALAEAAQRGLTAHNTQSGFKGRIERGRFGFAISAERAGGRAATGGLVAGCACCAVKGEWVHIEYLWVDHAFRERGYGRDLMRKVEDEAIKRGCIGLHLTTISFQAPDFYEKCGFEKLAELPDFPQPGYSRLYMIKRLPRMPEAADAAQAD